MKRRILSYTILVFLGALCSGCVNLGPDYCCPETRQFCEWQNCMGASVTADDPCHATWWRDLGDPVLDCLVETAFEENLSLQIACERIRQSRAEMGIATGLQYPQVQRVFGKHIRGKLSEQVPPISVLPPAVKKDANLQNDLLTLSFDVAWELDIWGRFRKGTEAAAQAYCARVAEYDATMVMVLSEVAKAYVAHRYLEELRGVIEAGIALQGRSVEIAEVQFHHGLATELDVAGAKSQWYATQSQLPAIEESLIHTRNALCVLLGLAPGELDDILCRSCQLPKFPKWVAVGVPADLLRHRPDVRAAEFTAMAACARVGVARTALYPHFGLVGTVGFGATERSNLFRNDSIYWKWGTAIDWDILNYGRLKCAVLVEDAHFQQAVLGYKEAVLRAQAEVEDSLASLASAEEQAAVLRQATEAAERAYDLALMQYQEGDVDFDRVLQSQQALLQQEYGWLKAKEARLLALIQLYKGLGGGWQWRLADCVDYGDGCEEEICEEPSILKEKSI